MQNFGKFKKISALKIPKAEQKNNFSSDNKKIKRNTYLILLAKHQSEIQKIKKENSKKE